MQVKGEKYRIFGGLQILLAFLLSVLLAFYFTSPKESLIPCAVFLTNIVSGLGLLAVGKELNRNHVVEGKV